MFPFLQTEVAVKPLSIIIQGEQVSELPIARFLQSDRL